MPTVKTSKGSKTFKSISSAKKHAKKTGGKLRYSKGKKYSK
jgi:hypothetical protein|tara:strand:+ start:2726 stop:2848 length:123 start_codon:yes stop_codon:yes gene_type:complete